MLSAPMNVPHASPYHLGGERFEELAPPRARSTSPLHKLRGWQLRGRAPEGTERREAKTDHERSASYGSTVPKTETHMMPAPLKSSAHRSRPTSSRKSSKEDGSYLQPNLFPSASPRIKPYISHPIPIDLPLPPPPPPPPPPKREDYLLPPSVYAEPAVEKRRQHASRPTRHSFDPPAVPEPPVPARDAMARYRNIHDISASASAPTTPRYPADWTEHPPEPPAKNVDPRKSTFTDPAEFGLFAQAMAGFGYEPSSESLSATPPSDEVVTGSNSLVSPLTSEDQMSRYAPFNPSDLNTSSFGPPSSTMLDQSTPSTSTRSVFDFGPSPVVDTPQTAVQRDLALSGAMSGMNIESVPLEDRDDDILNDDDELPDYEQSQREAADQARMKSLSRAAELESRWAASAPHRR